MTAEIPKVLVVDDEADTRDFLCIALADQNFDVLEAQTGDECLSTVLNQSVDIVLLDAMLPDINGFRCCEILHDYLHENCPPVLIITGLSDESSVNRAFEAKQPISSQSQLIFQYCTIGSNEYCESVSYYVI